MLNSRIHDMAKELGKTCIYNFAFVEQCETMKAPGQEHARPFGGALCPGAFLFVVRRFTPSAAEPDSPAGGWSCSLS